MISTKIVFDQMTLNEAEKLTHISNALCVLMRRLGMDDTPIIYIESSSDDLDIEYPIIRDIALIHFDEAVVVTSAVLDDTIGQIAAIEDNGFEDIDYGLLLSITNHRKFLFIENTAGKKIYDEYMNYEGEINLEDTK